MEEHTRAHTHTHTQGPLAECLQNCQLPHLEGHSEAQGEATT